MQKLLQNLADARDAYAKDATKKGAYQSALEAVLDGFEACAVIVSATKLRVNTDGEKVIIAGVEVTPRANIEYVLPAYLASAYFGREHNAQALAELTATRKAKSAEKKAQESAQMRALLLDGIRDGIAVASAR